MLPLSPVTNVGSLGLTGSGTTTSAPPTRADDTRTNFADGSKSRDSAAPTPPAEAAPAPAETRAVAAASSAREAEPFAERAFAASADEAGFISYGSGQTEGGFGATELPAAFDRTGTDEPVRAQDAEARAAEADRATEDAARAADLADRAAAEAERAVADAAQQGYGMGAAATLAPPEPEMVRSV